MDRSRAGTGEVNGGDRPIGMLYGMVQRRPTGWRRLLARTAASAVYVRLRHAVVSPATTLRSLIADRVGPWTLPRCQRIRLARQVPREWLTRSLPICCTVFDLERGPSVACAIGRLAAPSLRSPHRLAPCPAQASMLVHAASGSSQLKAWWRAGMAIKPVPAHTRPLRLARSVMMEISDSVAASSTDEVCMAFLPELAAVADRLAHTNRADELKHRPQASIRRGPPR